MLSRGALPVILLTIGLVAVPLASAQIGGFGYRVQSDDDTARSSLSSGAPQYFTYLDANSNDRPDAGEALYLTASQSQTAANDVRLAGAAAAPGTLIRGGDSDAGVTVRQISGQLRFLDTSSDGVFDRNETLYWDRSDGNSGTVSSTDLVLSGSEGIRVVGGTGQDLQRSLSSITGTLRFYDADSTSGFSSGDRVYYDIRSDGYTTAPDIRLGNPGAYEVGSLVHPRDTDATLRFAGSQGPTNVVYLDSDGDDQLDGDEPVFLSRSSTRVFAGDIRLANPMVGAAGSFIQGGDQDNGLTVQSISGKLAYADADGSNSLTASDTVYYDRNAGTQNRADGNDIILSGSEAGRMVNQVSGHHNSQLTSAPGSIKFIDHNGDANYNLGDLVYLDGDGSGFVSTADVQLSPHQPQAAPAPSDTDGDGVPDDEDACPNQPAATSDGCPADTDDGTDDGTDVGTDGGTGDGGDSGSALQQAKEAKRDAEHAQQSAEEARDAAREAKRISEENSELIGQVLEKLNETGQNGSPGPGLVLALIGLAGAALALRRRR